MANGNGWTRVIGLVVSMLALFATVILCYADVKNKAIQNEKELDKVNFKVDVVKQELLQEVKEIKHAQTAMLVQQTVILTKLQEIKVNTD